MQSGLKLQLQILFDCIAWKVLFKNYSCLILHRLAEEKTTLLKQCEDTVSLKAEETEQLRLRLEEAQQELLLAKNQVWTGNLSAKSLCLKPQQHE